MVKKHIIHYSPLSNFMKICSVVIELQTNRPKQWI